MQKYKRLRTWALKEARLPAFSIIWALIPELRKFVTECCIDIGVDHIPLNHKDFQNCIIVLNIIPGSRSRLFEIPTIFPTWKIIINNWEKLEIVCSNNNDIAQFNDIMTRLLLESQYGKIQVR
jgi:hypothetical protein